MTTGRRTKPIAGRVTIHDVVAATGVSQTTVSHVFSRKRHVSEATRQRVIETAAQLGYRPSAAARALSTGRAMTLALHLPFEAGELVLNPFFTSMLPAMSSRALEHGYSFVLIPADVDEGARTIQHLVEQRRIDGVVLLDPEPDTPLAEAAGSADLPLVTSGRLGDSDDGYWVDNDLRAACFATLEHLEKRGYRRPALIGLNSRHSFARDYRETYTTWCELRGLAPSTYDVQQLNEQEGQRAAALALATPDRPDAFVCMHDRLAVGALAAAADVGAAVPSDLGIVGTGDSLYAIHASPTITSLHVYPERLGAAAVDLLVELVETGQTDVPCRIVSASIVPRRSTKRRSR